MNLTVNEATTRAAFVSEPRGFDVVVLSRLTAENHGGRDNCEGLPVEEIEAAMLTDEQWQKVIDTVNEALAGLEL